MSRSLVSAAIAAVLALTCLPVQASAADVTVTLPCIDAVIVQVGCAPTPAPTPKPKPKPNACKDADLEPTDSNLGDVRIATLCLLNKERTSRHLPKLRSNPTLASAARSFARRLVAQQFFDHTAPDGTTMLDRIRQTSYLKIDPLHWWVGENIAYGTTSVDTPQKIVDSWMHSAGHKKNILNKLYRDIGLGTSRGTPVDRQGTTYVTDFGRRIR